MDFIKNAVGGGEKKAETTQQPQQTTEGGRAEQSGGFLGGIGEKLNSAAGGGKESEKNEDYLDKGMYGLRKLVWAQRLMELLTDLIMVGVDYVQQYMGGGDQSNESALEQAKDEQISDFIRGQYKSTTGKEFFVADKGR
jgi:hypothetical protein